MHLAALTLVQPVAPTLRHDIIAEAYASDMSAEQFEQLVAALYPELEDE